MICSTDSRYLIVTVSKNCALSGDISVVGGRSFVCSGLDEVVLALLSRLGTLRIFLFYAVVLKAEEVTSCILWPFSSSLTYKGVASDSSSTFSSVFSS